jgi:hypothetical protein
VLVLVVHAVPAAIRLDVAVGRGEPLVGAGAHTAGPCVLALVVVGALSLGVGLPHGDCLVSVQASALSCLVGPRVRSDSISASRGKHFSVGILLEFKPRGAHRNGKQDRRR